MNLKFFKLLFLSSFFISYLFALVFVSTVNAIDPVAFGIDVSWANGNMNFAKAKENGVQFAMIRDGFGSDYRNQDDKQFFENVRKATEVGISIGAYHFFYARNEEEARSEAVHCKRLLAEAKSRFHARFDYPIALDIEDDTSSSIRLSRLGKDRLTHLIKIFCNSLEESGYYVSIYVNIDFIKNHVHYHELFPRYNLWLAQWHAREAEYPCGMWQYASSYKAEPSGAKYGAESKHIDLNYSYVDYPRIIRDGGFNQ